MRVLTDGSLSLFYGGLESLLGPPQMMKDDNREDGAATLLKAMEHEHTLGPDAVEKFTTTNGMTTCSSLEWEFTTMPKNKPTLPKWCASVPGEYPERTGMREACPELC